MNVKSRLILLSLLGLGALLVSSMVDAKSSEAKAQDVQEALKNLQCGGPKTRVGVYGFYATDKLAAFEGNNIGDGLAAQLATELSRTGCFVVLDRTGISDILREQELALADLVSRETGPVAGHLIGAQVIIKGTITEFEPNKRGRGVNLGVALANAPLGIRLGRNGNTAHVAMDLAVVDATTGQIKFSHRVEADSKSGGWTIGLDHERASLGSDSFAKSPLGQAARFALSEAILLIARDLDTVPWRSQIASVVDESTIYLNAGVGAGLRPGDTFKVSTPVRTIIDPATGLLLDRIEREVGQLRIVSVREQISIAEPIDGARFRRGDYVHL
jgi:curli biogenesis system outer membrane secretion channel CsgG